MRFSAEKFLVDRQDEKTPNYLVFGLSARQYNTYHFNRQVRGLDIRKLDKGQFTPLGRLIDKSFQMPREYQCMAAD